MKKSRPALMKGYRRLRCNALMFAAVRRAQVSVSPSEHNPRVGLSAAAPQWFEAR
jgi:hypothetical protein